MAFFPNVGLDDLTQLALGRASGPASYSVHLFTNNITPGFSTVLADFIECTLAGYAALGLTPSSWTGATSGGLANYTYPTLTWNFSAYAGGVTIYGYYVQNFTSGLLAWCEAFATPYPVPAGGGQLNLAMNWLDQNS